MKWPLRNQLHLDGWDNQRVVNKYAMGTISIHTYQLMLRMIEHLCACSECNECQFLITIAITALLFNNFSKM